MKKTNYTLISAAAISLLATASCAPKSTSVIPPAPDSIETTAVMIGAGTNTQKALPKATAYRMSGEYADYVAIGVDSKGNITYFPAPADISPNLAPLALGNGWYLNRQGIPSTAVFINFTRQQYSQLLSPPSISELKAAIIPGARISEFATLPYSINDAPANLNQIRTLLNKL